MLRLAATGEVVYVGMAGERAGGGTPKGIQGRLLIYTRGRGAVSGFGEAALDRALADAAWLQQQLDAMESEGPKRAKVWAQDAIARLDAEVRWAICDDASGARALEKQVEKVLGPYGLWNRESAKRRAAAEAEDAPDRDELSTLPDSDTTFECEGYTIDLDVLYRVMWTYAEEVDGALVFNGNRPSVPGMKQLIHQLFGVPVESKMQPVNHAVRSECRDRLDHLGWATKRPGRSASYELRRTM